MASRSQTRIYSYIQIYVQNKIMIRVQRCVTIMSLTRRCQCQVVVSTLTGCGNLYGSSCCVLSCLLPLVFVIAAVALTTRMFVFSSNSFWHYSVFRSQSFALFPTCCRFNFIYPQSRYSVSAAVRSQRSSRFLHQQRMKNILHSLFEFG